MRYSVDRHRIPADREEDTQLSEVLEAIRASEGRMYKKAGPIIRAELLQQLTARGWPGEVALSSGSDTTITSLRNRTGLCLQTGNFARVYADLLKLQHLYVGGRIDRAILVTWGADAAVELGENLANAKRVTRELKLFSNVLPTPMYLVSIEE